MKISENPLTLFIMIKKYLYVAAVIIVTLVAGCKQTCDQPVGSGEWLTGDINEKFETVTNHLGGFGKAMWEIDYRFRELYWAGQDLNWEYAQHQIAELEETLELGLQRRPERAASAVPFLTSAIPAVEKAISSGERKLFERNIVLMISTCNSCHALEQMPFLTVRAPVERSSSIR